MNIAKTNKKPMNAEVKDDIKAINIWNRFFVKDF